MGSSTKRRNSVKHETNSWFSRWEVEQYLKRARGGGGTTHTHTEYGRGAYRWKNKYIIFHKLGCFLKLEYMVWERKYRNFPTNTTGRQKFYINQWNKPPRKAVLFQESTPLCNVCIAIWEFLSQWRNIQVHNTPQKRHDHINWNSRFCLWRESISRSTHTSSVFSSYQGKSCWKNWTTCILSQTQTYSSKPDNHDNTNEC